MAKKQPKNSQRKPAGKKPTKKRAPGAPKRPPEQQAEHLRPYQFPPGVSGNPKGRPRGRTIRTILREIADRDEGKIREALANVAIRRALRGDHKFWKEIHDRMDGTVRQNVHTQVESSVKVIHGDDEDLLDEADKEAMYGEEEADREEGGEEDYP